MASNHSKEGLPKRVYFAHPMSTYNTDLEQKCLERIHKKFPDYEIVNPNGRVHQEACRLTSMEYFKLLVDYCDVVVALPYADGKYGAGVAYEMQMAFQRRKPVYRTDGKSIALENFFKVRPLTIEETSKRNREGVL